MHASHFNVSLAQQIGQMIVVGFEGSRSSDATVKHLRRDVEGGRVGGVILFRHNLIKGEDHKALLSCFRPSKGAPSPFLLLDQEGGKVQRLRPDTGYSQHLSAAQCADLPEKTAREHYAALSAELANVGFNWNMAPSVDVDGTPTCPVIGGVERSYGTDPEKVARCAKIFIEELHTQGVVSCLKHFPGHGSAQGDTHERGVSITSTWRESELVPYKLLVKAGVVDAVMTAHLVHDDFDSKPATLSKYWIDRLRTDVGFDGVVITDDLHMGAILNNYGLEEIVLSAVEAGVDMLMFSNNPLAAKGVEGFKPDPEIPSKVVKIVSDGVKSGRLSAAGIQRSYERIMALKARYL